MFHSRRILTKCRFWAWLSLISLLLMAQFAHAQVTPWVDVVQRNGHLFVETEIAGIPGYALIDTGAQINGINKQFLEDNDLSYATSGKIKMAGAFGTAYRDIYREIPATIFGTELNFTDLTETNIGPAENQLILGAGFLKLLIFQFDYPNQQMRAMARESIELKQLRNVASKKDPAGGSPIVKVRLNDEKDVWLLLDTGYSGGIFLDRKFAKKQNWLDRYDSIDGESRGVISSAKMQRFNLPTMTLGDYQIENPIISVPADGEDAEFFRKTNVNGTKVQGSQRKAQGILGYDVLKHFILTIDYRQGYVHVEPGSARE